MTYHNIFVSHISEEKGLAKSLKGILESLFLRAVRAFVSSHEEDIRLGDRWFDRIETSLQNADTVLLLLTPKSVKRPWVNFEAGAAHFLGKHTIPVCANGLTFSDLPAPFDARQAVDLHSGSGLEKLVREIARSSDLNVPNVTPEHRSELRQHLKVTSGSDFAASRAGVEAESPQDTSATPTSREESLPYRDSDELFAWRLSDAFPGLRDVEVITDPEAAIDRLAVVFQDPIYILREGEEYSGGKYYPFWWFRGTSNCPINQFKKLSDRRCLIEAKELKISRLVAVRRFDNGERDFLYVESEGEEPVGCYDYESGEIEQRLKEREEKDFELGYYVSEEYALWEEQVATRAEYDDGSALIDGRPTRIQDAEIRIRYLTPYNFIICGKKHVINQSEKDAFAKKILNNILKEEASVDHLIDFVGNLPRPHRLDAGTW